jgi:hypothetical protein
MRDGDEFPAVQRRQSPGEVFGKKTVMAASKAPGPFGIRFPESVSPRTPGPLGVEDRADPNVFTLTGDVPGPIGLRDYLGRRIGTPEELQTFIVAAPSFHDVEEALVRLGVPLPKELFEGDFA